MTTALTTTPDLFRAFADPTRLRILNLLLEDELCVCELCDALDEIQPKVSRHLAYLRRAGLVTVRQQAKWKVYALTEKPTDLQRTLLRCVGSCLREIDVLCADRRRLRTRTMPRSIRRTHPQAGLVGAASGSGSRHSPTPRKSPRTGRKRPKQS